MLPPQLPDGTFGPTERGGRARTGGPDWLRLGMMSLALVLVLSLAVGVSAAGVLLYGAKAVGTVEVPNLVLPGDNDGDGAPDPVDAGDGEQIAEITEVLNILVVGSDDRDGLTDRQLQELGTDRDEGGRTDTIMLVQLDPRRDGAVILSFPRDLLVTRCDGTRGRINAAHAIGEQAGEGRGPSCLVETITTLTDVPIHHYVGVDLAGFIDVVDAIGGVSLYLDEPITDVAAGLDVDAGCVTMDGRTALGFVRARKIDNDFGRMARQQRFAREVVAQAASVGTLVNVPRLFSLVEAASAAVDTDPGFDLGKMRRLAFSLRDIGATGLDTRTVPGASRLIDGAAYVVGDEEQSGQLYTAFRDGSLIPDGVGIAPPRGLEPEDVDSVVVLNGAGIPGLARDGRLQLEGDGFEVSETGNVDGFGVSKTTVEFAPERRAEADLVAERIGDAVLQEVDEGEGITVVLGDDFDSTVAAAGDEASDVEEATDYGADDEATDAAADDATEDDSATGDPDDDPTPGDTATEADTTQFAGATSFDVDCG